MITKLTQFVFHIFGLSKDKKIHEQMKLMDFDKSTDVLVIGGKTNHKPPTGIKCITVESFNGLAIIKSSGTFTNTSSASLD